MPTISSSHWMLTEIQEQPRTLAATLRHYVDKEGSLTDAAAEVQQWMRSRTRLLILASGSSRHAGLFAAQLVRSMSTMEVEVECASEYGMYARPQVDAGTGVIVISQSGETGDTLAALREAKRRGHATLAVANVSGSSMAREADVFMPVLAGREVAVPATKSFTSQLVAMCVLARLAADTLMSSGAEMLSREWATMQSLPQQIDRQLAHWTDSMRRIAPSYAHVESVLFLGRGMHFSIAEEAALKLRESAYVPAIALASGELKHGPNALVSETVPLVFLATVDHKNQSSQERYLKTVQLLRDLNAQGAHILAIGNQDDDTVRTLSHEFIPIEASSELAQSISEVIPLQLLSYFAAVERGIDVDRPRNLVKAVVTE